MEELQNNIVIYNPSEDINLEVRVAEDTVWLTQAQMAKLLGTTSQNITLHIKNIYREHELETVRTCKDFLQVQMEGGRSVKRNIKTYNLDVIISVGYRVKSIQGTLFRIWANEIIKKHILKGYTINYQLTALQQSIEHRLESHEQQIQSINQRIDEMVQTALPPKYGLFFNGQVFDAYVFVVDLIKSATNSIRLADNYVDESVLLMLSKRSESVDATIFTERTTPQLQLDLRKHNAQYPPVHIKRIEKIHDRFLLIDDERLYHFGASFKDLGKKLFVVTLIEEPALVVAMGKDVILKNNIMEELQNNIVIYKPSEEINLEVRVAEETVWLNRQQIALLFGRDVKTIGKHILNAKQEELRDIPTVANFATVQYEGNRLVNRVVEYYNLDMIISIGYRVKSPKGVAFRQWANTILKNYIINGGIIYQKFVQLEARVCKTEAVIKEIIQTALPPKYGLFFNGQVFDAYVFVVDLIKSATNSIRLADNYVDESVLQMLSKRSEAVDATIFTERTTPQLQLDLRKHNAQYPPVHIKRIEKIHDRFLLIDDERLYHFGASFKDLGKKLFVVTLIEEPALIGAMRKMLS